MQVFFNFLINLFYPIFQLRNRNILVACSNTDFDALEALETQV